MFKIDKNPLMVSFAKSPFMDLTARNPGKTPKIRESLPSPTPAYVRAGQEQSCHVTTSTNQISANSSQETGHPIRPDLCYCCQVLERQMQRETQNKAEFLAVVP
jgi:hypothetical protein